MAATTCSVCSAVSRTSGGKGLGAGGGCQRADPHRQVAVGSRWTVPRGPCVLTSVCSSHRALRTSVRVAVAVRGARGRVRRRRATWACAPQIADTTSATRPASGAGVRVSRCAEPVPRKPSGGHLRPAQLGHRRPAKNARMSAACASGSSIATKWLPGLPSGQWTIVLSRSARRRISADAAAVHAGRHPLLPLRPGETAVVGEGESLVHGPRRRSGRAGEPVEAHVGEQLVPVDGLLRRRHVDGELLELLHHPGQQPDRRVVPGVREGLRRARSSA